MTFKLDTSGYVYDDGTRPTGTWKVYGWSDLDPFTQGYVEAALTPDPYRLPGLSWRPSCPLCVASKFTCDEHFRQPIGFSDLAPETLARIVEDCAGWRKADRGVYGDNHALSGRAFWAMRQSQTGVPGFPPLTAYLGDDGRVYLREAGQ